MLKRTAKHQYTASMSRDDAHAGRLAGVTNDQEKVFSRYMAREDREHAYNKKRTANAKKSGLGARECARRATIPGGEFMRNSLKIFAQQAAVTR